MQNQKAPIATPIPKCWRIFTLLLLFPLLACSELAVFVLQQKLGQSLVVNDISLTEDGKLSLDWSENQGSLSSYDVYLLELDPSEGVYAFTANAKRSAPLTYEQLSIPSKHSPRERGTLLESVTNVNVILREYLTVGKLYAIQVSDKRRAAPDALVKALLVTIDFDKAASGSAVATDGFVKISWNSVPGANYYEVYADEGMSILVGKSETNELSIKAGAGDKLVTSYYVRAYRGQLASPDVLHVALDGSPVIIQKLSAANPDGLYRSGEILELKVRFSAAVSVFGSASLPLRLGSHSRSAIYDAGNGSATLSYRYVIQDGDDTNDLLTESVLAGDYYDTSGLSVSGVLPANVAPNSLKNQSAIIIDTLAPTLPSSVGFSSAYSQSGNFSVNWQASSDLHFLRHNLRLCGDSSCSMACGSEVWVTGDTYALSAIPEGSYYACVRGEDTAGNLSDWASSFSPIRVDSTQPTVLRVSSQSAAGTYAAGAEIILAMQFSEAVHVTGDLRLTLASGPIPHQAQYLSGSGSSTLLFRYIVQAGDETSDLDYDGSGALAFQGAGSLSDSAGNSAVLTLPASGSPNSLAGQSQIVLDGVSPTVERVFAVTGAGSYKAPQTLTLAVELSESVTVTNGGNLRLALDLGATPRYASYQSGSGTNTLQFSYTIQSGDVNPDLNYASINALAFSGSGTLEDLVGNAGVLTLPALNAAESLASQSAILVDAEAPFVQRVYASTADGIYGESSDIDIVIEMNEAVTLTDPGNLRLQLETGGTDRYAVYQSGDGTASLTLRYTVVSGDVTGDLNYLATSSLAFNGSGSMVDALGNSAVLSLPGLADTHSLSGQSSISIDTSDLQIERVYSVTADGTYKAGDTIEIAVEFSKVVTVSDGANLQMSLSTGSTIREAIYDSGSNTDTLIFHYVVQAGDVSSDLNYQSNTALSYRNGSSGQVADLASQVATLFLPSTGSANSLAGQSAIVIDTQPPTVARVYGLTPDGAYRVGANIDIAVEFSEDIIKTGAGALDLLLDLGVSGEGASFLGIVDPKTLSFRYTVQAIDNTSDLNYKTTGALSKGGTISLKDAVGNEAELTLPALGDAHSLGGESALVLDNTAPTVSRVAAVTADGSYRVGTTLSIAVTFSEPVIASSGSALSLELSLGATRSASLSSGSGTDTLVFSYAIQSGDNSPDLDYVATSSLQLGGGESLQDAAGNDAVLTLASPGATNSLSEQSAIVVDTEAPTVTRVHATTANGSYGPPSTIAISIVFSEDVTLTDAGNLRLALSTGSTTRYASYQSGDGSDTLNLIYSIQVGDESLDLDYVATTSLAFLTSGSMTDAVGNPANLTLPAPGAANSLSDQSAIVIDGVAPALPVFTSPVDNDTLTAPITALSGTAEANSTVTLYKDGVLLGTTTASAGGLWTYTFGSPVLNGSYRFGAKAKDSLDNESAVETIDVVVAIPMPTADAGVDRLASGQITLNGSTTNAVSRSWTRVSGPGSLTFGTSTADTTTVTANADGSYVVRLTATNANGDSVSDEMTLVWDTTAPTFTGITDIWQHGESSVRFFWSAAYDAISLDSDITYEICYSSNPGDCGSNFIASVTLDNNNWDYTLTGLTAGTVYEVLVRAVDKAGNVSVGAGSRFTGGLQDMSQIVLGAEFGCAILQDETVKCWGSNNYLQLAKTSGTSITFTPQTVSGLSGVKKLAAGYDHACALLSDDTVKCWGRNDFGQLGNGGSTSLSTPTAVTGLSDVQDIVGSAHATCALMKTTGNIYCWGFNNHGQIGDGTKTNRNTITQVSGISSAVKIGAGMYNFCAAFSDKSLKCWGYNNRGQLGNGTTGDATTPVTVNLSQIESWSMGDTHSCAVTTAGAAYCWGGAAEGRLGLGAGATDTSTPTALPDLSSGASMIASTFGSSCAVMTSGSVKCWGANSYGQIGQGHDQLFFESPTTVSNLSGVSGLVSGADNLCARYTNGQTTCWGRDTRGALGDGKLNARMSPAKVRDISHVTSVSAAVEHSCALLSDKTAKCWGSNEFGQLGSGDISGNAQNLYETARSVSGLSNVDILLTKGYQSCAVLADGTGRCWGRNSDGQLGLNHTTDQNLPQVIVSESGSGSLSGIKDLALGPYSTCAIRTDDRLYCWGHSDLGRLGDGNSGGVMATPHLASKFTSAVKKASVGADHLCVILDDGFQTVQCAGGNSYGQLGNGNYSHSLDAVTVLTGAVDIASGYYSTCALLNDKTVRCWGRNNVGQLADGTYTNRNLPQQVSSFTNVAKVSVGGYHACIVLEDKTMRCWGENDDGRLGDVTLTGNVNQFTPRVVTGLSNAHDLTLGWSHSCMLSDANDVYCWGYNNRAQLGSVLSDYRSNVPGTVISRYTQEY